MIFARNAHNFSFNVVTDDTSIRRSSMQFPWKIVNSSSVMLFVSFKSSNQYSLSLHSFKAISNLEIKSFVPWAYCASWIFAPTDVPQRSNWFIKALSTPFCLSFRQRKTTFLAKFFDLFLKNTIRHIKASKCFSLELWFCSAKVMNSLCECYDMIACLTSNAAKPLITWRSQSYLITCRKVRKANFGNHSW